MLEICNTTGLNTKWLGEAFGGYLARWGRWRLRVLVRASRGADYSGSCRYDLSRFTINIRPTLAYPYRMGTHLARTRTHGRAWIKPVVYVEIADGHWLALFIFLHELYHWLVYKAGRNRRQKESMADRVAARALVDDFGSRVVTADGEAVDRGTWDFQDVEGFVAAARRA